MKRSALLALAAVITAVACQEIATAPQCAADLATSDARISNPPPPPLDTGAVGGIAIATFAPTSNTSAARSLPAAPGWEHFTGAQQALQSAAFFTIPVTYLFNPVGNAGYLHFHSDAANDVDADANGMVKLQDGTFSGKGFIIIETFEGTVVIDLSSVSQSSAFAGCGEEVPSITAAAAPARPDSLCFRVEFDDVTLDGVPVEGGATFFPGCYPRAENNFCDSEEVID